MESKIDKGKGPVSTILITEGSLKKGDHFVCGKTLGKVRAMISHEGKNLEAALPSMPVEILGMQESAKAGDEFFVVENEDEAKKINDFEKLGTKENQNIISQDNTKLFDKQRTKEELNITLAGGF